MNHKLSFYTLCLTICDTLAENWLQAENAVMAFMFYIWPFSVNTRAAECPYSLVTAHLSKPHPSTIWISFSLSISPTRSRYFDRGSICFKLTHFVSGNRSRETEEGETGKAAAALILRQAAWKVHFIKDVRLWWARQSDKLGPWCFK